ncbi:MAG TPA: hypothetical protein VF121_04235, partial [Thermoanaerobaculia bacterium]|nr:hypothetical protein [Thermoanaerobaculia bacterium]
EGRDADRSGLRLNLRARDIAGLPLQARLRLRTLDVDRERRLSNGAPASESRDRLYEASLTYDPPEGRFAVRAGRLGTSPFVGLGYLDGVLAELRPLDTLAVGGFYGLRPELEELGFENSGSKLGAFLSFTPAGRESPDGLELLLAGVREEGEIGVSRDYLTVETRYDGGGRWSFYEHAELDLNRDWREERADESVQLSNVAVTALARLSDRNRLSLSYERFQRYWTEETRFVPEELFDDFLRQGFRASWQSGRPEALSWSLTAGFRNRESAPEDRVLSIFDSKETTSLGLGVNHPRVPGLGISFGAQALGFTSSSADGVLVSLRGARRLGRGHEVSLTLGSSLNRTTAFDEERVLSWGRASLWLELPYDLFGRADVELLTGDDVEGQRWSVGLGYRL